MTSPKLVFITGYADQLQERSPNSIVVQKPIQEDELSSAVRRALKQTSLVREPPKEATMRNNLSLTQVIVLQSIRGMYA